MSEIKINTEEFEKIVAEALPKILKETFTSSYNNPLKTAVEAEIKESEGVIKQLIKDVFTKIFTNQEFKEKIANEVIASIIQKGIRG